MNKIYTVQFSSDIRSWLKGSLALPVVLGSLLLVAPSGSLAMGSIVQDSPLVKEGGIQEFDVYRNTIVWISEEHVGGRLSINSRINGQTERYPVTGSSDRGASDHISNLLIGTDRHGKNIATFAKGPESHGVNRFYQLNLRNGKVKRLRGLTSNSKKRPVKTVSIWQGKLAFSRGRGWGRSPSGGVLIKNRGRTKRLTTRVEGISNYKDNYLVTTYLPTRDDLTTFIRIYFIGKRASRSKTVAIPSIGREGYGTSAGMEGFDGGYIYWTEIPHGDSGNNLDPLLYRRKVRMSKQGVSLGKEQTAAVAPPDAKNIRIDNGKWFYLGSHGINSGPLPSFQRTG